MLIDNIYILPIQKGMSNSSEKNYLGIKLGLKKNFQ